MAKSTQTNVRRRGDGGNHHQKESSFVNLEEKDKTIGKVSRMMNCVWRLFRSYKLLLLFTVIVCILQILMGISFFNTFSHKLSPSPEVSNKSQESPVSSGQKVSFSCNVTSKEALSALSRAKSKECKQNISDLVCAISRGEVYPESLPRYCQSSVIPTKAGQYVGCYQDSFQARLLQGEMVKLRSDNSPSRCLSHCTRAGFTLAGLQYGYECFCGNKFPGSEHSLPEERCNTRCPGDEDKTCGGYLTVNIYETGFIPLIPSKLGAVTREEGGRVKIVYLLTIAGRASRQVFRLVRQLYSPNHYILVHIDSRKEFLHREVFKLSQKLPNLRLVTQRFSTIWGGASLLTMLLSSMKELLEMEDWTDWDFVLNLSESDYPVKTQDELVEFLSNNRESNFVKGHGRDQAKFIKKQGLDKTFYECENHMWRLGPRTLPTGLSIDGGSDWICLNKQFANYVVHSSDELVTGLKKVFSYTLLPAESFFHTVLRNSDYCMSYIDNNLHLTNWKRKQGCKCQYKHIVDWCGCSPNDFLPEDWAKLEGTRSRQIFFARKFEPIIHQGILNRVEEWSRNITLKETPSKAAYWQNIYHSEESSHEMDPSILQSWLADQIERVSLPSELLSDRLEIKALTGYTFNDQYNATLVLVEVVDSKEGRSSLELKINYKPKIELFKEIEPRAESLAVGSSFDPKELIFRNYLNLLTSDSKIAVKLAFSEGKKGQSIKFGWFDPHLNLVAGNKFDLNETSVVESVVPKVTSPLMPGVWTVIGIKEGQVFYKEEFLILPGETVKEGYNHTAIKDPSIEKFVDPSDRIEGDTQYLISTFFNLEDICSVDEALSKMQACQQTTWSSLFPDEKSQILGIDPESGYLIEN